MNKMIQSLVGFCCFMVGFSTARPFSSSAKGLYVPGPTGSRPACAEKTLTFCEKVDNYPSELIAKLLRSAKFDVHDFIVDESGGLEEPPEFILNAKPSEDLEEPPEFILNAKPSDEYKESPEFLLNATPSDKGKARKSRSTERRFNETKYVQECSVPSRIATPRIASNSKGEWRFIAQEESLDIQQQVKVHICKEKEECQKTCVQFYAPVSMKSLTSGKSINEDIFWVPSSCRCSDDSENAL